MLVNAGDLAPDPGVNVIIPGIIVVVGELAPDLVSEAEEPGLGGRSNSGTPPLARFLQIKENILKSLKRDL